MKVKELIEQLRLLAKDHGDIQVRIEFPRGALDIESVRVTDDEDDGTYVSIET